TATERPPSAISAAAKAPPIARASAGCSVSPTMPRMSYSRRMVGSNRWDIALPAAGNLCVAGLGRSVLRRHRLQPGNPVVQGPDRRLRPVCRLDLAQQALQVDLDRRLGNAELAGDYLVRRALDQAPQNLGFALRGGVVVAFGLGFAAPAGRRSRARRSATARRSGRAAPCAG